jgi:hypothetical protein
MEKGQGPASPLAAVTAQGRGFSAVQLRVVPAPAGIAWVETEEFWSCTRTCLRRSVVR